MRRLLFYVLMVAAIVGSTYFVFCGDAGIDAGIKMIEEMFKMVFDFSLFEAGFNVATISIYAYLIFFVINAILLVILIFMLLLNLGAFSRVKRFYTMAIWYFIGSLIFTVAMGYVKFDFYDALNVGVMDWIFELPWQLYLPILSSIVLLIFAVIFRESEKKYS